MTGISIWQIIIAIITVGFLIGLRLAVKTIVKGISKTREMAHYRNDELTKIDLVVEKLDYVTTIPKMGKVEIIQFHLNQEDEKLFYSISPEYLKRLRPKLECLVNQLEQNDTTYGHQYAERQFYIGDKLIFKWQKEVNI